MDIRYLNSDKIPTSLKFCRVKRLKLKKASGQAWLDGAYPGRFSMDTIVDIQANREFILSVTVQAD